MIISETTEGIYTAWRDDTGKRESCITPHSVFRPYFYILASDSKPENIITRDRWGNSKVLTVTYEEFSAYKNLQNLPLTRVYCKNPQEMRKVKDEFTTTFEADVRYTHRYAVDVFSKGNTEAIRSFGEKGFPEYDLRKCYWDMEWMQGGEYDGDITCIVMYDNFEKKFYRYSWFPTKRILSENTVREDTEEFIFDNEKAMILYFLTVINKQDPDMLISWFGNRFDLPKLLERCAALNLDARLLSPVWEVDGFKNNKNSYSFNRDFFGPIEQPIKGRITLSLDVAFERQWNDAQRGTLPSLSLDYVSNLVLGSKKLVSEKFPDKQEFFRRGWLEDSDTYLQYALIDVELIKELDETNYLSEAVLSLQRLIKAPFNACFYASNMGGIYFMRNAWWKAPSSTDGVKINYEGAMIYDPLKENTNGLHQGVAAFDYAQLYPSMMIARNISWETKSDVPTEFAVNISTPRDFSPVKTETMLYYKTDELGILPKSVLELKALRDEYKKKMKEATTKDDKIKWNNNQLAVKRLMASFYGIIGYQGFGWSDVDIAASITASAREAIRFAALKVEGLE
jgi:DNA polymerase I